VARVRVVLVRPEEPRNVGAAARAAANAGLAGLDLVRPGDWRTLECWRTAWGAHHVLERARVFPSLEAALEQAHYVAAFTGRGHEGPLLDVREVAQAVAALPEDAEARLVFGPEASGLALEEMALCGRRARIPAHPDQPSLNLSHAVMVAAYEVFRARGESLPARGALATHRDKEALLDLLERGLRALGGLSGPRSGSMSAAWRAFVHRLDLTPAEVRMWEYLLWKAVGRERP
jgi:tRNA/rRNA methyltransferase